jgi:uncharacterized membrane protein
MVFWIIFVYLVAAVLEVVAVFLKVVCMAAAEAQAECLVRLMFLLLRVFMMLKLVVVGQEQLQTGRVEHKELLQEF